MTAAITFNGTVNHFLCFTTIRYLPPHRHCHPDHHPLPPSSPKRPSSPRTHSISDSHQSLHVHHRPSDFDWAGKAIIVSQSFVVCTKSNNTNNINTIFREHHQMPPSEWIVIICVGYELNGNGTASDGHSLGHWKNRASALCIISLHPHPRPRHQINRHHRLWIVQPNDHSLIHHTLPAASRQNQHNQSDHLRASQMSPQKGLKVVFILKVIENWSDDLRSAIVRVTECASHLVLNINIISLIWSLFQRPLATKERDMPHLESGMTRTRPDQNLMCLILLCSLCGQYQRRQRLQHFLEFTMPHWLTRSAGTLNLESRSSTVGQEAPCFILIGFMSWSTSWNDSVYSQCDTDEAWTWPRPSTSPRYSKQMRPR